MFKQRLKFGVFRCQDYTQPKEKYEVEFFDRRTGERRVEVRERHPIRDFNRGDVVFHERDLAAEEPNRWEAVAERARSRVRVPVEVGAEGATLAEADAAPAKESPASSATAVADGVDEEELEQMTLAELQKMAKEEGINLGGAKVKADVIRAILTKNTSGVGGSFKSDDGD